MIGATVVMWAGGMVTVALINVVVALLAAFVAYGRRSWRRIATRPARRCSGAPAEHDAGFSEEQASSRALRGGRPPRQRVCKRLARSASRVAGETRQLLMLDTLCEIDEVAARASAVRHCGLVLQSCDDITVCPHQICSGIVFTLHLVLRMRGTPNHSGLGVAAGHARIFAEIESPRHERACINI